MPFPFAHSTAVIMIDISLALLHSKTAIIEGLGITVVNVLLLDGSCSYYLSANIPSSQDWISLAGGYDSRISLLCCFLHIHI